MKNLQTFNEFINESIKNIEGKIKIEKTDAIYIMVGGDEIMFSKDSRTIDLFIKALENKKVTSNHDEWTSIESNDGDIFIKRAKGSDLVTISNVESGKSESTWVTIEFEARLIDSIVDAIKK